jgi:hypothetical protein
MRNSNLLQIIHVSDLLLLLLKNEVGGALARMGERRDVYGVVAGKPEGERPLGRARHRWEDNIKIDLQKVGCRGMD